MIIDEATASNMADVFFTFYHTNEERRNAMSVLKIFDFDYSIDNSTLTHEGVNLSYSEDDAKGNSFLITPIGNLSRLDIDSVESVLNRMEKPFDMSPIMDSIGWVIRLDVDHYGIHFVGGKDYEVWNEPMMRWDEDLDDDSCDWKSGDGWRDGMNLDNVLSKRIDWVGEKI